MPRLGGNDASSRRSPAQAYARKLPKLSLRNIALFLVAFFVARNILRNDYRNEEFKYLKNSGMSEEEIERYAPKTLEERKKYVAHKANDLNHMKNDIAYLLQEVSALKSSLRNSGAQVGEDERDAGFREMDHMHELKRKRKEEQLLKDHPDFKPSRNIKKIGDDGKSDTETA